MIYCQGIVFRLVGNKAKSLNFLPGRKVMGVSPVYLILITLRYMLVVQVCVSKANHNQNVPFVW